VFITRFEFVQLKYERVQNQKFKSQNLKFKMRKRKSEKKKENTKEKEKLERGAPGPLQLHFGPFSFCPRAAQFAFRASLTPPLTRRPYPSVVHRSRSDLRRLTVVWAGVVRLPFNGIRPWRSERRGSRSPCATSFQPVPSPRWINRSTPLCSFPTSTSPLHVHQNELAPPLSCPREFVVRRC
jgi:hypothetical protein